MTGHHADERVPEFLTYTRSFLTGNVDDDHNITVKIDHSLRVLGEAEMIIAGESIPRERAETIRLAALYHDIGRFRQYAKYKTYKDVDSENHARLGSRTLLENGFLAGTPKKMRRLVIGTTFLHNVRFLPDNLPPLLDEAVRVVRDADKLDIIPVVLEHFKPDSEHNPTIVLGARRNGTEYSEVLVENIMARRLSGFRDIIWVNDFKLSLLSWFYDLNFRTSRRAFLKRNYIGRIFASLPDNDEMARLREHLEKDTAARSCIPQTP